MPLKALPGLRAQAYRLPPEAVAEHAIGMRDDEY